MNTIHRVFVVLSSFLLDILSLLDSGCVDRKLGGGIITHNNRDCCGYMEAISLQEAPID